MLEKEPLPERAWYYPIDAEKKLITFQATDSDFKVQFTLKPFLGCIGVAPANGEARSSIVPAEFGGNMDAPEVSPGNTLYLPVNGKGAVFYFGDGHAAMGDGEVAGRRRGERRGGEGQSVWGRAERTACAQRCNKDRRR